MKLLQVAREIRPGGGICGVAYELEAEFQRLDVDVDRLDLEVIGRSLPNVSRSRIINKLRLMRDVIWFTHRATREVRAWKLANPRGVVLTHGDAVVGDIYVNHGFHKAVVQRRGYLRAILGNPFHIYLMWRERRRFSASDLRLVVSLSDEDAELLPTLYPGYRGSTVVIPNGVNVEKFSIDSVARPENPSLVFIGHEFERKGLDVALEALVELPAWRLLIVGGDESMVATYKSKAAQLFVQDRVIFLGRQSDIRPFLQEAHFLILPSAYEASPLVVAEALAAGVPVIATPYGSVSQWVATGVNGFLIEKRAGDVIAALSTFDVEESWADMSIRARESGARLSWGAVAEKYYQEMAALK
ncbi:glycosyltransferase family 4 protein [Microbacterium dextranolyticum]|uniref:Glycosyl transferase family 1 domain-containing protein n=1 Tax=Microbacterium dextranolyticum TaxID=36806 RepID=A0A9W6HJE6_9MICO|nr:glycosyltransferase family 4 protein [Microbacterium dextranolyticum]MBM7462082.1 UDP-glucose:(heptosyl)LPS alpha-1,3-glucosyltransferase [Microbacterium dextranolyticum]GLJ94327.1 hypothetical protein GCM10017591_03880 [Microbacterium dextranolyticum]